MATVHANGAIQRDLPFANPWLWLTAGLALSIWAWLWTLTFGNLASDLRVLVLALGLLLAGVGVWLRGRDRHTVYLAASYPGIAVLARLLMGLGFGVTALAITAFFLATALREDDLGYHPGAIFLVALSTVPTFVAAALRTLKRDGDPRTLAIDEETGVVLLLAAGVCALGSFTLNIPALPTDWDTFRLLLRVAGAAGLFGSALAVASTRVRRWALSLLFVLHFTAITSACLSPPPSPWIVSQAWTRLFRPYLEFLYLNNAYHYYAPEPGPTSYLWFRVIHVAPDKKEYGLWYKVPRLDEQGHTDHTMALEYQRYIALTEAVGTGDAPPPDNRFNPEKKEMEMHPFWRNRMELVPNNGKGGVLGVERGKHPEIPLRPGLLPAMQVFIPNDNSRRLLSSYVRFVARKFAVLPGSPDLELKSIKVYRVIHYIPPVQWIQNHIPPTDPESYNPYYVGNYTSDGEYIEDLDPYRFWLLPVIREEAMNLHSTIRDYARLHAGDPNWIRRYDPDFREERWTDK